MIFYRYFGKLFDCSHQDRRDRLTLYGLLMLDVRNSRKYGFKDSKRGMSAKNKMTTKESTPAKRSSSSDTAFIPFPVTNMEHILTFISLCLRMDDQIEMVGYDTFSLIMFFLRMFFEENLAPSLKEQGFVCVKDLLEKFKRREWKQEWAPLICRRIASRKGKFVML